MATVLVERSFPQAVSLAQIEDIHHGIAWCLDAHAATPLFHGIDASRTRALCVYAAPDVEAIRRVGRRMQVAPETRVWAASVHGPWPAGAAVPALTAQESTFALLDRVFDRPVAFADFGEAEAAHNSCLAIYGVRFLATFFAVDRTRMVCLYAAPDLEAVRGVNRTASYPFTEVWAARPHDAR